MNADAARGYINCKRCTRWRPVSDYETITHKPAPHIERTYLRKTCISCQKLAKRTRAKASVKHKEYNREYQRNKRREAGMPERELTELTSRNDQSRESKRKARRAAGIPTRPIGPRNKGRYGGGKMK